MWLLTLVTDSETCGFKVAARARIADAGRAACRPPGTPYPIRDPTFVLTSSSDVSGSWPVGATYGWIGQWGLSAPSRGSEALAAWHGALASNPPILLPPCN